MGFYIANPLVGGITKKLPEEAYTPAPEDTSGDWDEKGQEAFAAGMARQSWMLGMSPSMTSPIMFQDDDDYFALDDTANDGYPAGIISKAGSSQEASAMRVQIDRENADLEKINSSSWGLVGEITGAVLTPENIIPGATGPRALSKTAALFGGIEVARETALHQQQLTRTLKESAVNTALVTGATALLGKAALMYESRAGVKGTAGIKSDVADVAAPDTVNAPRALDETGTAGAMQVRLDNDDMSMAGGKLAEWLSIGPDARVLTSSSVKAKQIVSLMSDSSFMTKGGFKGITSGVTVESLSHSASGRIANSIEKVNVLSKKSGMKNVEFDMAVSDAMEAGGKHSNEFVVKAAKEYEATTSKIYDELVEYEMLPGSYEDLLRMSKMGADEFEQEVFKAVQPKGRTDVPLAKRAAAQMRNKHKLGKAEISLDDFRGLPRSTKPKGADGYLPHVYKKDLILKNHAKIQSELEAMILKETKRELNPQELRQIADDIIDNMMGGLPLGVQRATTGIGALSPRVLSLTAEQLAPYMERSASKLMANYVETVTPYLEMKKTFGEYDLLKQAKEVKEEYQQMLTNAKNTKERKAIAAERETVLEDIERIKDRILHNAHKSSLGSTTAKVVRGIQATNAAAMMGNIVIASIPDMARPLAMYGMRSYANGLGRALSSLFSKEGRKALRAQSNRSGVAVERTLNQRAAAIIDDTLETPNAFADSMGKLWPKLSGFQVYTDISESITTQIAMDWVARQGRIVSAGKPISKTKLAQLARMGLDEADLKKINSQIADGDHGGLLKFDTLLWKDTEFAQSVESAIGSDVRRAIIRPGTADRPLWMDDALGKLLSQFMGFLVAATNKMLVGGVLQSKASMDAWLGLTAGVFLGGVVAGTREYMRGGDPEKWDNNKWLQEGVDRMGVMGIYNIGLNTALKMGNKETSRYTQQSFGKILGGPTISQMENIGGTVQGLYEGDTDKAVTKGSKLLPFVGVLNFRELMLQAGEFK